MDRRRHVPIRDIFKAREMSPRFNNTLKISFAPAVLDTMNVCKDSVQQTATSSDF